MLSNISVLEYEEQDQHDLDIEIVPQDDPYPYPTPILNQKPKWVENLIEAAENDAGDLHDRIKKGSRYHKECVALSHTASLPTKWCNKLPQRCYLMISNDPQFGPLMNKMDHSIPPLERRDKRNIQYIRRIWKGSHAHS